MNRFFVLAMLLLAACYLLPLSRLLQEPLWGTGFPVIRTGWLAAGVMSAGVALAARHLPWRGMRLLYAAVVLVCIPALFPHPMTSVGATLCQLSLLAMAVLVAGGIAGNARARRADRVVVTGLMMAGAAVTLWTLTEFYRPDLIFQVYHIRVTGGRMPGLLMQPNVTGSFLAVVVTLGLWRWLRSGKRHSGGWLGGLAAVMAAMHATQSTIALLGTFTGFVLLYLAFGRGASRAFGLAAVVLLAGWAVTLWHPGTGVLSREYENSWGFRLQMLRASLALVMVKPWLGWGYGSFAGVFPKGLAILGEHQMDTHSTPEHPHNELMYWMVQGGLVAAAGIVLIAVWGLRLLIRAFPGRQHAESALRSGDGWGWGVCVVPVVLHMQTEFPLYVSALHWLVLSVCAGLALAAVREQEAAMPGCPPFTRRRPWLSVPVRCAGVAAGGAAIWFTVTAALIDTELNRIPVVLKWYPVQRLLDTRALNPWADSARYEGTLGLLYMEAWTNGPRDGRVLERAINGLQRSAIARPDPNTWRYLMQAYRLAGDTAGEAAARDAIHRVIRYVFSDETLATLSVPGVNPVSATTSGPTGTRPRAP
ncbi:O-antigen ligase family protein [Klebsiella aerogenes]|uniref:O-antigen ligase family protein n=1 Tax=Klebsiella aerogenes TaxID=548 RepID=UPI002FFC74EC